MKLKAPLLISPGSDQVYRTLERDGILQEFTDAGATVMANACGACIGQWKRSDAAAAGPNSIVSSFNRNFPQRNDGSAQTLSFLASPEIVVALALAGSFDSGFADLLAALHGPVAGARRGIFAPADLPPGGFVESDACEAPADDPSSVAIAISPTSERLELLQPFSPWNGEDFKDLPILVKTKGATTTDQISPAGPWLQFRGHLGRISENMLMGARNAFFSGRGQGISSRTGQAVWLSEIARDFKSEGQPWVIIGDENYGEGSSREHAAMSPRFLGCVAVIARSFARIHRANLKKQGILPLVFADAANYDGIGPHDRISIVGLRGLAPGKPVTVIARSPEGAELAFQALHDFAEDEIPWFKAGSALNMLPSASAG